jgi:ABC-type transport system substrate-binding protein
MRRLLFSVSTVLASIQFILGVVLYSPSFAQEWTVRKSKGTIKIVNLFEPHVGVMRNYAEGLVTTDTDNNLVACLAEDWRWTGDNTIEFRLRKGVTFHNGEKFNAEAVRVNWEAYKG